MRNAFLDALTELVTEDEKVILLTADLGFGVFEDIATRYPKQFLNVGVAEQNMTGIAAGLALEGHTVFTYSIGNFPTLRCLEQIRNDACYHDLNINIVCTGGGFSYGALGMSHHATEDLSIMRALPGMTVVAPCSKQEAFQATKDLAKTSGVGYLRIDKTQVELDEPMSNFKLGKATRLKEGTDFTIIASGGIAREALSAAKTLAKEGVNCRVVSMHTIKPIDSKEIKLAATETNGILTIEENTHVGGLGSAVAEVCMDTGCVPKRFERMGLDDCYSSVVGSQDYLRRHYQLDATAIVKRIQG